MCVSRGTGFQPVNTARMAVPQQEKTNMSQKLLITNCRLFNASDDKQTTSVLIENGTITQLGQIDSSAGCDNTLDAQGRIIAPGFIDVHIQGAGGADILDATPEALKAISRTCARFGTTSFLATTVFKPDQQNQESRNLDQDSPR